MMNRNTRAGLTCCTKWMNIGRQMRSIGASSLACLLLFSSNLTSGQVMYRCTDPDGRNLSFRPSCPPGQVSQKMPKEESRTVSPPEDEKLRRIITIAKEAQLQKQMSRDNAVGNAIALRNILIGMDANEVVRAWGPPSTINRTVNSGGKSEQWVYRSNNFKSKYVYLDNDVVRSFQDSE